MLSDCIFVEKPTEELKTLIVHPENFLFSMIVGERSHVRELGYRRIIKARTQTSNSNADRTFRPPNIHYFATDYTEIIDRTASRITTTFATKNLRP